MLAFRIKAYADCRATTLQRLGVLPDDIDRVLRRIAYQPNGLPTIGLQIVPALCVRATLVDKTQLVSGTVPIAFLAHAAVHRPIPLALIEILLGRILHAILIREIERGAG